MNGVRDVVRQKFLLGRGSAISAPVFMIAALMSSGCDFEAFSRRAAHLEEERTRFEKEEKDALRCVASLAARDPRGDAEQDVLRGDRTPVGISNTPHDPPETNTYYEDACEQSFGGHYRSTGKWFTYTHEGFSFFAQPKSYNQCRGKARDYARSYNRRMLELAPAAVQRFCRSQKLTQSSRQWAASRAVLGGAVKTEMLNGTIYKTTARLVIDTSFGPVLVTSSYLPASNLSCTGCESGIGVAYLKEDGSTITARRRWPLISTWKPRTELGTERYASLLDDRNISQEHRLTTYPLITVQKCGWTALIELRPEGHVERGAIRLPLGQIKNIRRDQSFDVVRPGNNVLDHYRMVRGRFIGPHGPPRQIC